MRIPLNTPAEVGLLVRAVRRDAKLRQDDLAGILSRSKQFVTDLEHGKQTVQLGLVLGLLKELGVQLSADVPKSVIEQLNALQASGGLAPPRPRASRVARANSRANSKANSKANTTVLTGDDAPVSTMSTDSPNTEQD